MKQIWLLFHFKTPSKIVSDDIIIIIIIIIIITIIINIRKTCLYNFDPLKPHFHIVKRGKYRVLVSL